MSAAITTAIQRTAIGVFRQVEVRGTPKLLRQLYSAQCVTQTLGFKLQNIRFAAAFC
jgi:hypothetical protein